MDKSAKICDGTMDVSDLAEDLSMAVAASLDYPQAKPSQVNNHVAWTPDSATDWSSYNRQRMAFGEAEALSQDPNLRAAIGRSMEEAEASRGVGKEDREWELRHDRESSQPSETRPNEDAPLEPRNIESRIKDLSNIMASGIPLIHDKRGDTYIYIDPPARQPEQDIESYGRYAERYIMPILMQSKSLLAHNSPFFENLFGSTYQHRIIRRRRLVNKLPNQIKFVIDLTPPTEGDEAVYLTTELCCPEGVRKWYQAGKRWSIPKTIIGGRDEHMLGVDTESYRSRQPMDYNLATSFDQQGVAPDNSTMSKVILSQTAGSTAPRDDSVLVPEYSPVRHRYAIERILAVVQGLDPHLDSAPKVWTAFGVAKYLEIAPLLTDYIVRWLRSFPNSFFIEALPETTLRIADGLRCHNLCRDTFAILVGEEALQNVHRGRETDGDVSTTVFGRKRTELPEEFVTSLEYASKAFVDRMGLYIRSLVDDEMRWFKSLPEFEKLCRYEPSSTEEQMKLERLMKQLRDYIRGSICRVLCTDYLYMPGPREGFSGGDDLFPRASWITIWNHLLPGERILTRSFWQALAQTPMFEGPSNFCIQESNQFSPVERPTASEETLYNSKGVQEVYFADVANLVQDIKQHSRNKLNSTGFEWTKDEGNTLDPLDVSPLYSNPLTEDTKVLPIVGGKTKAFHVTVPHEDSQQESGASLVGENTTDTFDERKLPKFSPIKLEIDEKSSCRIYEDVLNVPQFGRFAPKPEKHSPGPLLPLYSKKDNNSIELDFDIIRFFRQAAEYLESFGNYVLSFPDSSLRAESLELGLTNTLVCLTDSEWKYLPLWAGGNDDGSGGVFSDDIPMSYDGFLTAGPKVRTGSARSTASEDSDYTMLQSIPSNSDLNTSNMANDGYSDTLPRGIAVPDEADVPWDPSFYQSKGKNVERHEDAMTTTMKSESSITFGSSDDVDWIKTSTEEEENEEQRAQRMVDIMEAKEQQASRREKGGDPIDTVDEAIEIFYDDEEDEDDDDDDTINGDFDEDEDEDMVLI